MKFVKIGEMNYDDSLDMFSDEGEAQIDKRADLKEQADLIVRIDSEGVRTIQAVENFSHGLCDCCTDYESKTVAYEFYKLEA